MAAPVRVAIIGCGGITAFTHLPQLLHGAGTAEIVGLCDRNLHRVDELWTRFSLTNVRRTSDDDEILSDPLVDAVIVAAWPSTSGLVALRAIEAGKHVLLQKPFILTGVDRDRLLNAVYATNRQVLALPFIESVEQFRLMKEIVQSGALGEIGFARIRTTVTGPEDYYADVGRFFHEHDEPLPYGMADYARGRGCLSDMGPYALATYHYLFGPAVCLSAHLDAPRLERTAILTLAASVEAPPIHPLLATIEAGWSKFEGIEICSIFGSSGSICMQANGRTVLHTSSSPKDVQPAASRLMLPMSPFRAQQKWLDAIVEGGPPSFRDSVVRAVWTASVLDDAYERNSSAV